MGPDRTVLTNTQNTPIEALQRSFAMRTRRYRLRRGSDGAAPGGDGVERDLEMLEDVTVSLITERRVSRPWGLDGGGPGAPARTGSCREATRAGPSDCSTGARSACGPATCSAS